MADIKTFKLIGGRYVYEIDSDDQEWFAIDCVDFLPLGASLANVASGAPADPVVLLAGVTQMPNTQVRIQGTQLLAMLTGGDPDPDAEPDDNCCTFRFYTSTGERFDRSMYFKLKDK